MDNIEKQSQNKYDISNVFSQLTNSLQWLLNMALYWSKVLQADCFPIFAPLIIQPDFFIPENMKRAYKVLDLQENHYKRVPSNSIEKI